MHKILENIQTGSFVSTDTQGITTAHLMKIKGLNPKDWTLCENDDPRAEWVINVCGESSCYRKKGVNQDD